MKYTCKHKYKYTTCCWTSFKLSLRLCCCSCKKAQVSGWMLPDKKLKTFLFCKTEKYFSSTILALIDKRSQPAVEDWEPWRARVQEEAWSRLVQIDWRDPNLVNGSAGISVSLLVSTIPLIFKASAVCRKLCSRFCGTDTVPWYMYVTRASRTLEEKIR